MRMRVLTTKLRVEIENETRVFLESLDFEIEMRVSQKSAQWHGHTELNFLGLNTFDFSDSSPKPP